LPELFPTRVRATGSGIAYNVGRFATAVGVFTAGTLVTAFGGDFGLAVAANILQTKACQLIPMKTLNVGLIGCGFMGRTHSNAHRKVGNFFDLEYRPVLKAICDFNADKAAAHAATWGFESVETDYKKLLARKDIDLVDICLPNNLHAEVAIAAAKAGKMILCEKPLARDGKEAEPMVKAVEKAGVPNFVSFNYRRIPAVTLAKQLIDEGRLGKIFHYRAKFLQDWTISKDLPQGGDALWRLDVKAAGSGVVATFDLTPRPRQTPVSLASSSAIMVLMSCPLAMAWPCPRWVEVIKSSGRNAAIEPMATASCPAQRCIVPCTLPSAYCWNAESSKKRVSWAARSRASRGRPS